MKHIFIHQGAERTLTKHPTVAQALAAGSMTEAEAATRPWYIRCRVGGKQLPFTLPANVKAAERCARDILNGHQQQPAQFTAWLAEKEAQRSLTVGALAKEWLEAGLPFSKTKPRTQAAQDEIRPRLNRALAFWRDQAIATITAVTCEDFAAWRKPYFTAVDRELSALSCLFTWAVLAAKIKVNPIAKRPRFQVVKHHCHELCPDDDETLHKILGCLFDHVSDAHHPRGALNFSLSGGALAFCALTGLRPGEPEFLLKLPPLENTPRTTKHLAPGTLFRDTNGQWQMKVMRSKRGQNPFVKIHPAAEAFLSAWRAYLARVMPDDKRLFPCLTKDDNPLNRALNLATRKLGLPHMRPHGMRAYYVKVRRSQGAEDNVIAGELGQSSNGALIRSTYGDPGDLKGGNLFDWLPEDAAPAWNLLASKVPVARETQPVDVPPTEAELYATGHTE